MEHYFTKEPNSKHQITTIEYNIDRYRLNFVTDTGVFARTKIDYGTNVLIRSLPPLKGDVLDLGCGYGPIGISLAMLNPIIRVTMTDTNVRAVELAINNIQLNNIKNARAFQSDGFENIKDSFSVIVSNPPIRAGKKVIYSLFEQSIEYLEDGGSLYLVIQKKQGAKSAIDKLISVFGNCESINKKGGYWVLCSVKE